MRIWNLFALPVVASTALVGCFELDGEAKIENLDKKLDGQSYDLRHKKKYLAEEKVKFAKHEKAREDIKLAVKIKESLDEKTIIFEEAKLRNEELGESIDLIGEEFEKYQARYRAILRKDAIGESIDLSATKGDEYKDVRILSISPLRIRVYMPSGPQEIPLKELTPEILAKLQMSEEEANKFTEKLQSNTALRAEKYKKWKEGLAERKEEGRKTAILQKIKDMQAEIFEREDVIRIKIGEIKGWKSKASQWEANAFKENNQARRKKAIGYSEVYRDKAQELADENSNSYIELARLNNELEDLKRLGIR